MQTILCFAVRPGASLWADLGPMWTSLFSPGLPLVEKILRPILVYFFLVVLLRLFGKRELAQLNPFDLVVLLSLSNTVQNAIIGEDNSLIGGLVGAFSLCAINYLVVRFLFKHRRLDQLIEGRPAVLIRDGQIRPHALARELITRSEMEMVAHRQGFPSLAQVQTFILEPGGTFVIEGKPSKPECGIEQNLLARLDRLTVEVQALRSELARASAPETPGQPPPGAA